LKQYLSSKSVFVIIVLNIFAGLVCVKVAPAPPLPQSMCSVSAANLTFGIYTPKQMANLDGSAYVSVVCTAGTPYLLGMDNGLYFQSPWRRGRNSGSYLNYQLYVDSGRSQVWGMIPGSSMMNGTGTGSLQNIPVYGRIPGYQEPSDGSYGDSVTVTVEYVP